MKQQSYKTNVWRKFNISNRIFNKSFSTKFEGINLTKAIQHLFTKDFQTLLKEIKIHK
jgi:hypothetical protein